MVSIGRDPRGSAAPDPGVADDLQMAQAIARGDTRAFDTFYERYGDRLYQVIYYQINGQQTDAEDVLQETMMAAVKALPRYRGEARLFTWLCAIAQHKITDYRRRQGGSAGRKVALPLGDQDMPGADALTQETDTRLAVRQALASLSDDHRQVLILKYVVGFSVNEIAASTRRSPKAVESLLTRARESLRTALKAESGHV